MVILTMGCFWIHVRSRLMSLFQGLDSCKRGDVVRFSVIGMCAGTTCVFRSNQA